MHYFRNLNVGLKLSVLICIAFLSSAFIGLTGYHYLQKSNTEMNKMYEERLIPVKLVNECATNVRGSIGAMLELMVTENMEKKQKLQSNIDKRTNLIKSALTEIGTVTLDPAGRELLANTEKSLDKQIQVRTAAVNLAQENKNKEAYQKYLSEVEPLTNELTGNLRKLMDYYTELSQQTNVKNKAEFDAAMLAMAVIWIISLIVLILAGLFITKMITGPLGIMVQVCRQLAEGDFSKKELDINRKDEFGWLGKTIDAMQSSLRLLMQQITQSSDHLAASSEQLNASATQSAEATNQVAASITSVAQGADQQLNALNEMSQIIRDMSAGIQHVSGSINEVSAQSAQAAETATKGNHSLEKAIKQMKCIEHTVTSSAMVITKLGERSQEIGQIIDTIAGISGQTNLLALNAAIEAARAGEQGRGFAVVAEEVRKLAEQSHDAAKQIALLINEIQSETNQAVESMKNGTKEVNLGAEVVNASGKDFEEITMLIGDISGQTKEVAAAIEQMVTGSKKIVENIVHIDNLSKSASAETQLVSAASEEQAASIEEIAASSRTLADLANNLQKAVNKFSI